MQIPSQIKGLFRVLMAVLILTANSLFLHAREINLLPFQSAARALGLDVRVENRLSLQPQNSGLNSLLSPYASIRKTLTPAGQSNGTILHIQDIHQNLDAQTNIAHLLTTLIHHNKIDLVGLEGAFEELDLNFFRSFEDQDSVHAAARYLFKQKELTGPVFTLLTQAGPLPPFVGVDDKQAYDENVHAVRDSEKLKEKKSNEIQRLNDQLKKTKRALFNEKLLAFDQKVTAYQEKEISFGDYLKEINRQTSEFSPNIELFLSALSLETKIDFNQVERERKALLQSLVSRLFKADRTALTQIGVAYQEGRIRHQEFYATLHTLWTKAGISLSQYPAMDSYILYVLSSYQVDGEKLFSEIRKAERSIYQSLTRTKKERALVKKSRHLFLRKKLIDFELGPEEWNEYKLNRHPGVSWVENIRSFEAFYEHAESRNSHIAANFLSALKKNNAQTAVLITGGFHAKAVNQILKDKNYTIINAVPKVSKVDRDGGTHYLSIFTQEKTPLEKLGEGEKLFLTPALWTRGKEFTLRVWTAMRHLWGGAQPALEKFESITGQEAEAVSVSDHEVSVQIADKSVGVVAHFDSKGEFLRARSRLIARVRNIPPWAWTAAAILLMPFFPLTVIAFVLANWQPEPPVLENGDDDADWMSLRRADGTLRKVPSGSNFPFSEMMDQGPTAFKKKTRRIAADGEVEEAIWNQGKSYSGGPAEQLGNAIDGSLFDLDAPPIGRHGSGFHMGLAVLKIIQDKHVRVRLLTRVKGGPARFVWFKKSKNEWKDDRDYQVTWGTDKSAAVKNFEKGTVIKVELPDHPQRSKFLTDVELYLRRRFYANRYLPIYFHRDGKEEQINRLDGLRDENGKLYSHEYPKARVDVYFNEHGFSIVDPGTGITDEVLMKRILVARSPQDKGKKTDEEKPEKKEPRKEEYHILRTNKSGRKSMNGLMLVGQEVMNFDEPSSRNKPTEFFLELPPESWSPESRDRARLSHKEMALVAEKIVKAKTTPRQKVLMLNALAKMIRGLQRDPTEDLPDLPKAVVTDWLKGLDRKKWVVLPNHPGFEALAANGGKRLFLDSSYFYFHPRDVNAEHVEAYQSNKYQLYLVDFEDPTALSFVYQNKVYFSRAHMIPHLANPAPPDLDLDAVLNALDSHYRQHRLVKPGQFQKQEKPMARMLSMAKAIRDFSFLRKIGYRIGRIQRRLKDQPADTAHPWLARAEHLFHVSCPALLAVGVDAFVRALTSTEKTGSPKFPYQPVGTYAVPEELKDLTLTDYYANGEIYVQTNRNEFYRVENGELRKIEGVSLRQVFKSNGDLFAVTKQDKHSNRLLQRVVRNKDGEELVTVKEFIGNEWSSGFLGHEGDIYFSDSRQPEDHLFKLNNLDETEDVNVSDADFKWSYFFKTDGELFVTGALNKNTSRLYQKRGEDWEHLADLKSHERSVEEVFFNDGVLFITTRDSDSPPAGLYASIGGEWQEVPLADYSFPRFVGFLEGQLLFQAVSPDGERRLLEVDIDESLKTKVRRVPLGPGRQFVEATMDEDGLFVTVIEPDDRRTVLRYQPLEEEDESPFQPVTTFRHPGFDWTQSAVVGTDVFFKDQGQFWRIEKGKPPQLITEGAEERWWGFSFRKNLHIFTLDNEERMALAEWNPKKEPDIKLDFGKIREWPDSISYKDALYYVIDDGPHVYRGVTGKQESLTSQLPRGVNEQFHFDGENLLYEVRQDHQTEIQLFKKEGDQWKFVVSIPPEIGGVMGVGLHNNLILVSIDGGKGADREVLWVYHNGQWNPVPFPDGIGAPGDMIRQGNQLYVVADESGTRVLFEVDIDDSLTLTATPVDFGNGRRFLGIDEEDEEMIVYTQERNGQITILKHQGSKPGASSQPEGLKAEVLGVGRTVTVDYPPVYLQEAFYFIGKDDHLYRFFEGNETVVPLEGFKDLSNLTADHESLYLAAGRESDDEKVILTVDSEGQPGLHTAIPPRYDVGVQSMEAADGVIYTIMAESGPRPHTSFVYAKSGSQEPPSLSQIRGYIYNFHVSGSAVYAASRENSNQAFFIYKMEEDRWESLIPNGVPFPITRVVEHQGFTFFINPDFELYVIQNHQALLVHVEETEGIMGVASDGQFLYVSGGDRSIGYVRALEVDPHNPTQLFGEEIAMPYDDFDPGFLDPLPDGVLIENNNDDPEGIFAVYRPPPPAKESETGPFTELGDSFGEPVVYTNRRYYFAHDGQLFRLENGHPTPVLVEGYHKFRDLKVIKGRLYAAATDMDSENDVVIRFSENETIDVEYAVSGEEELDDFASDGETVFIQVTNDEKHAFYLVHFNASGKRVQNVKRLLNSSFAGFQQTEDEIIVLGIPLNENSSESPGEIYCSWDGKKWRMIDQNHPWGSDKRFNGIYFRITQTNELLKLKQDESNQWVPDEPLDLGDYKPTGGLESTELGLTFSAQTPDGRTVSVLYRPPQPDTGPITELGDSLGEAVVTANGRHYFAHESQLYRLENGQPTPVPVNGYGEFKDLKVIKGRLYAAATDMDGENDAVVRFSENETIDAVYSLSGKEKLDEFASDGETVFISVQLEIDRYIYYFVRFDGSGKRREKIKTLNGMPTVGVAQLGDEVFGLGHFESPDGTADGQIVHKWDGANWRETDQPGLWDEKVLFKGTYFGRTIDELWKLGREKSGPWVPQEPMDLGDYTIIGQLESTESGLTFVARTSDGRTVSVLYDPNYEAPRVEALQIGTLDLDAAEGAVRSYQERNAAYFDGNKEALQRLYGRLFRGAEWGVEWDDELLTLLAFFPEELMGLLDAEVIDLLRPFVRDRPLQRLEEFFTVPGTMAPFLLERGNLLLFFEQWTDLYKKLETSPNKLRDFYGDISLYENEEEIQNESTRLYVLFLKSNSKEIAERKNKPLLYLKGTVRGRLKKSVSLALLNEAYIQTKTVKKPGLAGVKTIRKFETVMDKYRAHDLTDRELEGRETIHGQSSHKEEDNTGLADYAVARELPQNSMDAHDVAYKGRKKPKIEIESYIREKQKQWVRRVSDQAGMTFEEIIQLLLVIKAGSKQGQDLDLAGIFGQGFYTLFVDYDEARIKTKINGKAYLVVIKKDAKGLPLITEFTHTNEPGRGTVIEWIKNYEEEPPELDMMMFSQAVIRYTGAVQDHDIYLNGRLIKEKIDLEVQVPVSGWTKGSVTVRVNRDHFHKRGTQRFLDTIPYESWMFDMVQPKIRHFLFARGVTVDVSLDVPLSQARQGLAVEEIYKEKIQRAVAVASLQLTVLMYLKHGQLPPGLSESLFALRTGADREADPKDVIQDSRVLSDAHLLNERDPSADDQVAFESYQFSVSDEKNQKKAAHRSLADLLMLVEVDFEGARFNLWDYRRAQWMKLSTFKNIDGRIHQSVQDDRDQGMEITNRGDETESNPYIEIDPAVVADSPTLQSLKTFFEAILAVGNQHPIGVDFYYKEEGRLANFNRHPRTIIFNLFHLFSVAQELNQTKNPYAFFRKWVDALRHEGVHLDEEEDPHLEERHESADTETDEKARYAHFATEEEFAKLEGLFLEELHQSLIRYLLAKDEGAWETIVGQVRSAVPTGPTDSDDLKSAIRHFNNLLEVQEKATGRFTGTWSILWRSNHPIFGLPEGLIALTLYVVTQDVWISVLIWILMNTSFHKADRTWSETIIANLIAVPTGVLGIYLASLSLWGPAVLVASGVHLGLNYLVPFIRIRLRKGKENMLPIAPVANLGLSYADGPKEAYPHEPATPSPVNEILHALPPLRRDLETLGKANRLFARQS